MSINSQKQTFEQSQEWYKWFNKKYNRFSKIAARLNNPNKQNN
jgi:hypothetical protein|tara:strand:+ start:178 stop:306 length:129 start_codon:yes stop_codon:yes gene_type:complete